MNASDIEYSVPTFSVHIPLAFDIIYYCILAPVAYVGNLFTCIIVSKRLLYRNNCPDVLIGGLALNDFLTCAVVFTPSIIAQLRQQWYNNRIFCQLNAAANVWYLYTTFAIIVFMSVERWIALIKPFYYDKIFKMATLKMKMIIGGLGFFCLLLGSFPLFFYGVELLPGWYCAIIHYEDLSNGQVQLNVPKVAMAFTATFILSGVVLVVGFTIHIIVELVQKGTSYTGSQMEKRFAKLMGVVGLVFLITWLPTLSAMTVCLNEGLTPLCRTVQFWTSRAINLGVAINPLVYGAMKKAYRRGYVFLFHQAAYYLLFCRIPPPKDTWSIFDTRKEQQGWANKVAPEPQISSRDGSSSEGSNSTQKTEHTLHSTSTLTIKSA